MLVKLQGHQCLGFGSFAAKDPLTQSTGSLGLSKEPCGSALLGCAQHRNVQRGRERVSDASLVLKKLK